MAILKVARMGHPVLREPARDLEPEEIGSPETARLVRDMIDTMKEYGGIGLAAPQVHHSLQLAIIEFGEQSSRYPGMGAQPLTVFINPRITVLDPQTQGFWEGCLSIPEIRGLVFRPRKVQVDFLDQGGHPRRLVAEDFLSTVVQHELDHLAGKLFIDRVEDTTKLAFLEEHRKYWAPRPSGEDQALE